ncbi:hypothetical protein MBLNU457_g2446t1 [Dothideomycetes sp. NU457]
MASIQSDDTSASFECGHAIRKQFLLAPDYLNVNHGSYGCSPRSLIKLKQDYQFSGETRPDLYLRSEFPTALKESRQALADYVHAPVSACVFVPNTTTGVNTILRSLVFQPKDVIIHYGTIYDACEATVLYLEETTPVQAHRIPLTYPVSDDSICDAMLAAIQDVKAKGLVPRIAVFDTISASPGVRVPFERLTKLCKEHSVLSLVDGAHSVGMLRLNMSELDPDFFVSNCHKWLYVPRSCAFLYVPQRNQALIRSSLPTSFSFVPRREGQAPPFLDDAFAKLFEGPGTTDSSSFLTVKAAIEWRRHVTWEGRKGEEAVLDYCVAQAEEASAMLARRFGTEVLANGSDIFMKNVRLPLDWQTVAGGDQAKAKEVGIWIAKTILYEYNSFMTVNVHAQNWWFRMSAQIYLTMQDWEKAADIMAEVCERVKKGEWKS